MNTYSRRLENGMSFAMKLLPVALILIRGRTSVHFLCFSWNTDFDPDPNICISSLPIPSSLLLSFLFYHLYYYHYWYYLFFFSFLIFIVIIIFLFNGVICWFFVNYKRGEFSVQLCVDAYLYIFIHITHAHLQLDTLLHRLL